MSREQSLGLFSGWGILWEAPPKSDWCKQGQDGLRAAKDGWIAALSTSQSASLVTPKIRSGQLIGLVG